MLDPHTGFVKAEHIPRLLQEEVAWSQAATESCSVIFFRVDQYERLLSAIGPDRMNQMQGTITSLIQDFLKEDSDIAGRSGDEAFLLIIPRSSSRIASNLAQHICLTVSNMYVPGLDERSTISVGIAAYPEHAQTAASLTECARRASLQVQQHGGNGIQVYTPA